MELKLFIAALIFLGVYIILKLLRKKTIGTKIEKPYKELLSWTDTLWSALFLASVIMFFFVQAFKIPTGSMRMTFLEGDHLFVNKFIYGFRMPFTEIGKRYFALGKVERGDIIVFECPPEALTEGERARGEKKDYIKRCVAVAGDTVEVKDKVLYINGVKSEESYVNYADENMFEYVNLFSTPEEYQKNWEEGKFTSLPVNFIRDNFGPVTVPENCYMAMGDNRDASFDSRFWGPLKDKYIKGSPLVIYWPLNRIRITK